MLEVNDVGFNLERSSLVSLDPSETQVANRNLAVCFPVYRRRSGGLDLLSYTIFQQDTAEEPR